MSTIRVHLADAPTDVLVWLADRPDHAYPPQVIESAVAPDDADDGPAKVARALRLLSQMGCVQRVDRGWQATTQGVRAVEEARAQPALTPEPAADTTSAKARSLAGDNDG